MMDQNCQKVARDQIVWLDGYVKLNHMTLYLNISFSQDDADGKQLIFPLIL